MLKRKRTEMSVSKMMLVILFLVFVPFLGASAQEGGHGPLEITTIAFSPTGEYMAYAGGSYGGCLPSETEDAELSEYAIHILNSATLDIVATLTGHRCQVTTVAWSPDGTKLASAGLDAVYIWDIATTRIISSPVGASEAPKSGVVWSADSTWIADIDLLRGATRIWRTSDGSVLTYLGLEQTARTMAIALNPTGTLLAQAASDGATYLWDVSNFTSGGDPILVASYADRPAASLAWSPDGSQLALGGVEILLIDPASGNILATLTGHENVVTTVAWNKEHELLASGSSGRDCSYLGHPVFSLVEHI